MSTVQIIEATTGAEIAGAAALFRAYAQSLDFSLEFQGFSAELEALPGRYGPPTGCLLLATLDTAPVGCVALREIFPELHPAGSRVCEMKRLFVRPEARAHRIGRLLCQELITRARAMGYDVMKLDTSSDMHAAQRLYRSLGFVPCARYNDDPMPCTLYFELALA